jgi:hypothetical protein
MNCGLRMMILVISVPPPPSINSACLVFLSCILCDINLDDGESQTRVIDAQMVLPYTDSA